MKDETYSLDKLATDETYALDKLPTDSFPNNRLFLNNLSVIGPNCKMYLNYDGLPYH